MYIVDLQQSKKKDVYHEDGANETPMESLENDP